MKAGGLALRMRVGYKTVFLVAVAAMLAGGGLRCKAQAALLMEEPYGFFGALNPTGHNAIYFEHICAETPTHLRRCGAEEDGAVIARYQGIAGYDWIAIPLIPYLYSVDDAADVPEHVDRATVERLRSRYREAHLGLLGERLEPGTLLHGGWTELVGVAYERRIYAFRFATTEAEDDAMIAAMNSGANRSHFNLLFNNCADFARVTLNRYFPHQFGRSIFPDAGMTTPKQLAWKLERYARKHPAVGLEVLEIPQVPGYRKLSHANKGIAESLATTVYAVPIALANPYLAGGLFVDYLVRSRYRLVPRDVPVLSASELSELTEGLESPHTQRSAGIQASSAAAGNAVELRMVQAAYPGLEGTKATHE